MNNEQLEELVKRMDDYALAYIDLDEDASETLSLGSKTIAEMHLVIQLLKAKVELLEFQKESTK
jgi:hypothetical protein